MQLADYAMIANSVPQDVRLKSANEKQMEKETLAGAAMGNESRAMQNKQIKGQMDAKDAIKSALQKYTRYNSDGSSVTDHRGVANELGQAGYIDESHDYTMNQQKQVYAANKDKMDFLAQQAQGILSQPPEARPQAYAQAVQQAQQMGIDVAGKETYNGPETDNWLNGVIASAQDAKTYFEVANRKGGANNPDYILVTDADGNQFKMNKHSNDEAQPVMAGGKQIRSPVYSQQSQYGLTATRENAKADVERATKPQIEAAVVTAKDKASAGVAKEVSQQSSAGSLDDAEYIYNKMKSSKLDKVYGRGESVYPELMRSQEGIDIIANRDQLVAMLKLGARGQLKGQGAVSDSDAKTLSESTTVLGNPNISPKAAREALDRAMLTLRRSAGKAAPEQQLNTGTEKATAESNAALAKELGL